jgi:hypothetical protein
VLIFVALPDGDIGVPLTPRRTAPAPKRRRTDKKKA